ncbi:MAG: DUF4097 family beta strand repeat protein [Clostridia bacterium]|nr:DUF4097 family beta strand repeat protein [Clostridia bacterium]
MKRTKLWIIIATALIIVGAAIFTAALSAADWDFSKFQTTKYETNTHSLSDDFSSILINSDTADIEFIASRDGKCQVVCFETQKLIHSVSVDDNALVIENRDERKWYEFLSFNIKTPKITVYLPRLEFSALSINESTGDVKIPKDFRFENLEILVSTGDISSAAVTTNTAKIKTDTGDITLRDTTAKTLDLWVSTGKVSLFDTVCEDNITIKVSTGKTDLQNIHCKNLKTTGNTGDIILKSVIASEKFEIERTTGDISFEGADAAEIFIKTDTGDIKGSLLSEKIFITETDTGYIDVPKTITGGRCEITTDTGNIKIAIVP